MQNSRDTDIENEHGIQQAVVVFELNSNYQGNVTKSKLFYNLISMEILNKFNAGDVNHDSFCL